MKKTFILCGFTGLCMEVLWTGLHSILAGEFTMTGKTSLLMFPVYGCAAVIRPLSEKFAAIPLCIRGCIYTVGIFAVEFISGSFFRLLHICPWDYSRAPLNYKGLIRLDYAPLWFAAGIFFEKYLENSLEKSVRLLYDVKKDDCVRAFSGILREPCTQLLHQQNMEV